MTGVQTCALPIYFVIAVARIGETYYPTLAAAAAAVQSGETVVMLADTAEGLIPCGGVSFTDEASRKCGAACIR